MSFTDVDYEKIYGSPKCPCCGIDISKENDLWESFGDIKDINFNWVEIKLSCPNEDCGKELVVNYIRSSVEEDKK